MGIFDLFGDIVDTYIAGQMADENRLRISNLDREISDAIQRTKITGKWDPVLNYIPDDLKYELIKEDPELRKMQMDNISQMREIADGRISSKSDSDRIRAIRDANDMARARNSQITSDSQARGISGGGLEIAMRQQSGQDAANRLQDAELQNAANSALERMQATGQLQSSLSSIRGQDFSSNQANADIINKFNVLNSERKREALDKRADIRNKAMLYNLERDDLGKKFDWDKSKTKWETLSPEQKEQIKLDYAPLFKLNDSAWNNIGEMANMAAGMYGGGGGGGAASIFGGNKGTQNSQNGNAAIAYLGGGGNVPQSNGGGGYNLSQADLDKMKGWFNF